MAYNTKHDPSSIAGQILANQMRQPAFRESPKEMAARLGVSVRSIYKTNVRLRKSGKLAPVEESLERGPNNNVFSSGTALDPAQADNIPDRAARRKFLAMVMEAGSTQNGLAAVTRLNQMDAEDAQEEAIILPTSRGEVVDILYRILCSAPPDMLEEALARRQKDLSPPAPEAAVQANTGLPAGGSGVEGRSS